MFYRSFTTLVHFGNPNF